MTGQSDLNTQLVNDLIQKQFINSICGVSITGSTSGVSINCLNLEEKKPVKELVLKGMTPFIVLLSSLDSAAINIGSRNVDLLSETSHQVKINNRNPISKTITYSLPYAEAYAVYESVRKDKKNGGNVNENKKAELLNRLALFIGKKGTTNYVEDPVYYSKIDNIFKEISKIEYSTFSIEVTALEVLNVNLLLNKDNVVMMSIPLSNNVLDLTVEEVMFSFFENNKFKFSSSTKLSEIGRVIQKYL